MGELRWIGKTHSRPDAPDKAAGRALYIHDCARPGMLYGAILFSEHAHARILDIDTSRAEKLPGVRAVITAYNTPEIRIGFLRDNFALKKGVVRQFRDEVAAVAAIDADIAREALSLIEVKYEPLEGVFDPHEAMKDGAVLVHSHDPLGRPRKNNLVPVDFHHESGDLAAGRREAHFVSEGAYSTPLIQQSCMGTAGCIAELDLRGNLTIWAKTQIPFLAQRDFNRVLSILGFPGANCRVILPCLGGAFGTGLDTHAYELIAILLANKTGRPVKIVYDRFDEFSHLSPRQSSEIRIEQGCDAEGRLTFRHIEVLQDNGAYTSWGATFPSVMLLPATSLYRVPSVFFDARLVYTNNTYCQAMRGYGNPEVTLPIECSMDELAEQLGMDPLELRLRNCNRSGEITPMKLKVGTCGLRECLEKSARKIGWKAGPSAPAKARGSKRRGIGIASLVHVGGGGRIYQSDGSGIILKLDDFGNVNVSYGGVEMGQGLHSAIGLCVAEALSIRPEKVHVNQTDTATCPWDVGTHASRGAFMACQAALLACEKAKKELFAAGAEIFPGQFQKSFEKSQKREDRWKLLVSDGSQAPEGDLLLIEKLAEGENLAADITSLSRSQAFELKSSTIRLMGLPEEVESGIALDKFLRSMHFRQQGSVLTVSAFYDPPTELPDWKKGTGNLSASYAYGVQAVSLEVDVETGEVELLHFVSAHDVGRILNRQTLEGQCYGALAQGIGYALYEQVLTHEGRVLNPGFTDYKIATIKEMDFPVDLIFVETNDPTGPFGAKGVGEPGLVPTAPAIANAIADATGVRIRDLPITPERIVAALKAARCQASKT